MDIETIAKLLFWYEKNFVDVGAWLPDEWNTVEYSDKKVYRDIAEQYLEEIKSINAEPEQDNVPE